MLAWGAALSAARGDVGCGDGPGLVLAARPPDAAAGRLEAVFRALGGRSGGLACVLNVLRAAEVGGQVEAAALADLAPDAALRHELALQAYEDARHALGLLGRMRQLGLRVYRVPPELDPTEALLARCRARDARQVFADRGAVGEAELMELVAGLLVAKRGFVATLWACHAALAAVDADTRALVGGILAEEAGHAERLVPSLGRFERRFSRRAVSATLERLGDDFARITAAYVRALERCPAGP